jgi:hypothetical protein
VGRHAGYQAGRGFDPDALIEEMSLRGMDFRDAEIEDRTWMVEFGGVRMAEEQAL